MTPRQKLAKGREGTLDHMPYLARYVYSLRPVETEGTGTLGVSQDGVLFWDPVFVIETPMGELSYVILHEALHLLLRHHARAVECYGEYPSQLEQMCMNIAADLVIDQTMDCMRDLAPKGGVRLGRFCQQLRMTLDFPPNLEMTEYYRLIMSRLPKSPQGTPEKDPASPGVEDGDESMPAGQQQDTPSEIQKQDREGKSGSREDAGRKAAQSDVMSGGSASDGVQRPWESRDETWEAFQEVIAAQQAEQAIREAQLLNPGWVPGNLIESISQFLRPQPSPFDHLRSVVASSVSSPIGGRMPTYRRLSRKQPPDMSRLRGYITTQSDAVVIVDTSGSMSDRETKERALQVISDGLRKLRSVMVICADTRIRTSERLSSVSNFRWAGGGGTDMSSVICRVDKERRPDSIVVVTDAATPWPVSQPRARVVVALTQETRYAQRIPAWCKVVPLFKEKQ